MRRKISLNKNELQEIQNKIVRAEYELELRALKVESDFWNRL